MGSDGTYLVFDFFFFCFLFLSHFFPFLLPFSSGMEEKDIPEAAQLVTAMGEYVGRPSNPQLLRGAVKAHRKMIGNNSIVSLFKKFKLSNFFFLFTELIRRWKRKQQHRSPSSTCGLKQHENNKTRTKTTN